MRKDSVDGLWALVCSVDIGKFDDGSEAASLDSTNVDEIRSLYVDNAFRARNPQNSSTSLLK